MTTIRIWTKENRFFIFENAVLSREYTSEYEVYVIRNGATQLVGIFPKVNVVGIELYKGEEYEIYNPNRTDERCCSKSN